LKFLSVSLALARDGVPGCLSSGSPAICIWRGSLIANMMLRATSSGAIAILNWSK
jgi:hypothetical protein